MYDELVKRLRDAAKMSEALIEYLNCNYQLALGSMKKEYKRAEEAEKQKPRWIPVTERSPENTEKYSTPTQFYEDIDADYDEETDEYYFPEGWWEVIKNWDEYSCVAIEDTVTHWMPLPEPPKEE